MGTDVVGPRYDDIAMRKNLPGGPRQVCPDIVPYGPATVPDPKAFFAAAWDSDVGQPITAGEPNNIYVRGKNGGTAGATAQVFLYYAEPCLILWPSLWANHGLTAAGGGDHVDLAAETAGEIVVGAAPFTWMPPVSGKPVPYVLLARTVTPSNPCPIPPNNVSLKDLLAYLASAPVTIRDTGHKATLGAPNDGDISWNVQYAQGDEGGQIYFYLECAGVVGSKVAFSSDDRRPKPPIAIPPTLVTADHMSVGVECGVLAGLETTIKVTVWPQGELKPGASVTLNAMWVPSAGAKPGPNGAPPEGGLLLGSFTTRLAPA